ncbi:MAG: hypothetical protein KIS76_11100 [Pyrinomonadaceae bacterium]|nr:hypothetical protein [Pyrinomonadaceae bacterium]
MLTSKEKNVLYAGLLIGLAGVIGGLIYSERFWASFLQNAFYFLSIALGGAVFVAINYVSNAGWSSVLRRVPEAMMSCVSIGAVSILLLFFGKDSLYEWTTKTYSHNGHELVFKNSYLTTEFFFSRMIIFLAIWVFLIYMMRRESYAQDATGNLSHTNRNKTFASIFLVVFGITFTFAVFDWIMSIEPMFFSTIYAFYHIAGLLLCGSAAITILTILLRRRGYLKEVGDRQMHALGKLVFGFATFWAYIWVCQFLLIYYANIPEETIYYVRRTGTQAWSNVFYASLFLNWVIPFLMLIRRGVKSSENWMLAACAVVLAGHWVDLYVLIFPAFFADPMIGLVDIALPIGFVSLFLLCFARNLKPDRMIPVHDPYLSESIWQERTDPAE